METQEIAALRLKEWVEQFEQLDGSISGLQRERREACREATSQGFQPKIIKKIMRIRKRDRSELEEPQAMLAVYQRALKMEP